jgi:hypothetical protein
MNRLQYIGTLATIALVALGPTVRAQAADSIVPRRGAWGAEVGDPFGGATVLKFVSPTSAWTFGVGAGTGRTDAVGNLQTNGDVNGAIGHRWYHSIAGDAHLHPTFGFGVTGQYARYHQSNDTPSEMSNHTQSNWAVGAYGEFGATWFFTPHLSLGALGRLSAGWGRQHETFTERFNGSTTSNESTADLSSYTLTVARLTAAVYF